MPVQVNKRRLDLLVGDKVFVELKVLKEVDNFEKSQGPGYPRFFNFEVGLLLNFGMPGLFSKRYIHPVNN